MSDLFNDLLNFLKEYLVNEKIDITDFVSKYLKSDNTENVITIFKTLNSLKSKNYITVESHIDKSTSALGVDQLAQDHFSRNQLTFSRIVMFGSITNDGLHYLEQKQRDKKQEKLYKVTLFVAIVGAIGTLGSFLVTAYHSTKKLEKEHSKTEVKELLRSLSVKDSIHYNDIQKIDSIVKLNEIKNKEVLKHNPDANPCRLDIKNLIPAMNGC